MSRTGIQIIEQFQDLQKRIIQCVKCPRLVAYREMVARNKRKMYKDCTYWGKPVPGFGDPRARGLIIGLAPAAHGGNRTGRLFTGDRSGDWLYGALHQFGYANQPDSLHAGDGLVLDDVYVSAAARCAPPDNKPLPGEFESCQSYLLEEIQLLENLRAVVVLGKVAFDAYLKTRQKIFSEPPGRRPNFGHGAVHQFSDGITMISSYHPSQRNTQTGRLTAEMFDSVFASLRAALDCPS